MLKSLGYVVFNRGDGTYDVTLYSLKLKRYLCVAIKLSPSDFLDWANNEGHKLSRAEPVFDEPFYVPTYPSTNPSNKKRGRVKKVDLEITQESNPVD